MLFNIQSVHLKPDKEDNSNLLLLMKITKKELKLYPTKFNTTKEIKGNILATWFHYSVIIYSVVLVTQGMLTFV